MTDQKSQHTPGPWSVVKDRFNNSQVYAENRNILDDLPIADNIIEKANASLIAAAPELLEALQRHTAVSSCDGHGCTGSGKGVDDCPYCQGRAAIAKAEGRGE